MLGIYVAGDSGAFLNPAICLASCMFRKMPWRRLPMYWLAEFLGAFVASGVVYANYINGINKYENGARTIAPSKTATAGIFATYPDPDLTKSSQFFDQFIGSAVLVFIIFALKDDSNKGKFIASGAWFPLGLFFTMVSSSPPLLPPRNLPLTHLSLPDRNRHLLRLANRLRHQPSPRLRPPPHDGLPRLRQRRLVRRQLLLLGPHRVPLLRFRHGCFPL
jgi:aquaglyceroporin related protein